MTCNDFTCSVINEQLFITHMLRGDARKRLCNCRVKILQVDINQRNQSEMKCKVQLSLEEIVICQHGFWRCFFGRNYDFDVRRKELFLHGILCECMQRTTIVFYWQDSKRFLMHVSVHVSVHVFASPDVDSCFSFRRCLASVFRFPLLYFYLLFLQTKE